MAYIELTKGGSDSRTKGTISVWVKRSATTNTNNNDEYIWGWGENNSSDSYLRFDAADNLEMHCDGADGTFNSSEKYQDVHGWYHIVFSLDGSNADASLRRRLWVNGVQIDEGKSGISAFSAAVMGWHSTQDLWIGSNPRSQQGSSVSPFKGYISHFHYCKGYSYAASDFGQFDSTTGEWSINSAPNVQYGDEGIFLKFEDGSNLDLDSSGNSKALVTNGTILKSQDNPSNVFCKINVVDTRWTSDSFSNNATTLAGGSGFAFSTGTLGVSSGKYYFECQANNWENGDNSGIGISSAVADSSGDEFYNNSGTGVGYGLYSNGIVYGNSANHGTWTSTGSGAQIIMVAMDLDNNKCYWGYNGVWGNSSNPATNSNGVSITPAADTDTGFYFPAFSQSSNSRFLNFNFGDGYFGGSAVSSAGTNASGFGIFEYDVPAGFTALCTKGINSF